MKAIQFKNFSEADFTWSFDSLSYTFPAGSTIFMEDFKAEHFAKHLVDSEMNRLGLVTDNKVERAKLMAQCFPSAEVVTPEEAFNIEETKKAKKGKKAKKEVVEEEFSELNPEA